MFRRRKLPGAMGNQYAKPVCKVTVAGKDITGVVTERLHSIALTDNRGLEVDTLDIQLVDHDGKLAIPPRGASIELWLGWSDTGLVHKGVYTVDETEHSGAPDMLSIRARSADLREALKEKREHTWHSETLGSVLTDIAQRSGLKAHIDSDLAGIELPHIDQANESDANVLARLAEQFDAVVGIKAGVLICAPVGGGKTATGKPLPHIELVRSDGDGHRFLQADRNAYSGVKAYYYLPNSADKKEVVAGDEGSLKELRSIYADENSALRAARSELSRITRGTATLSYTLAHGRADLMPELTYSLHGVKEEIDAITWLGKSVRHSFSTSGYTVELELESCLPDMELIDNLVSDVRHTGVVAYYRDSNGKQQKVERGDMTNPKRMPHLYASRSTALAATNREWKRLNQS